MSIQVTCPNGHQLRVKDRFAGKTGRCPHCKAQVEVPNQLTDDFILDMVGAYEPPPPPAETQWQDDAEENASVIDDEPRSTQVAQSSGLSLLGSSIIRHHKVCQYCHEIAELQYASCRKCGQYFDD